jgi:hypothetical protein
LTLEDIGLAVVRIEGKIDLLASRNDALERDRTDHESRLRTLEQRPVITTKAFWSAILGTGTFVGAIVPVVAFVLQK